MNRRLALFGIAALSIIALSGIFWVPPLLRIADSTHSQDTATPTPEPPALVQLQITVRDQETQLPLPQVQVAAGQAQGSTDQNGTCTLTVQNGTSHTLSAHIAGYLDWQDQLDIAVRQASAPPLEIALEPNQVKGQVQGVDGKLLPNATLIFHGEMMTADDQARFVLRRVSIGDSISILHSGYEPHHTTYDGTPLETELTPTQTTISVYDAMTGKAIAQAAICQNDRTCGTTDATGTAEVREVIKGIPLSINRAGYISNTIEYLGETALRATLFPKEMHGVIRDAETGQPLTNTVFMVNGQIVPLDEDGHYHLPDLTQVYTLFIKSPGYKRITIPIGTETRTSRYDALDTCLEPDGMPCLDINLPPFSVRGIYITFNLLMWNQDLLLELIDLVDRSPILNAIVVDIKSDRGHIAFESDDPIVASGESMVTPRLTIPELLQLCKEKHIYTVARMVIFKDSGLIKARPELAVRHPNGEIFYDREGMAWGDPTREEVWDYNIAITKEAIRLGFDEIQYDYLRYPSDSTSLAVVRALVYSIPSTMESRTAAISGFVAAAKQAVDPTPAFLSADLFGSALSLDPDHDMRIGQRLKDLAPHVDYVCPMIYPSTFIPGNLGLDSPSDYPYEVIEISMRYGHARTNTLIRPWLQHYWYDRYEIAEQRRAAEQATDVGWCYWNAGGKYDRLFFLPPEGLNP